MIIHNSLLLNIVGNHINEPGHSDRAYKRQSLSSRSRQPKYVESQWHVTSKKKMVIFFRAIILRRECRKWGKIISVKIAKSRRHCEVIAQSELSRRFLTFTTVGDLRFIYARTPLCNNNTGRGREGRRRRPGAEEVAAPLTRTNDSHFKRHLTLFSAPGNNAAISI